ncbi:MAG: hypothetical protein M3063_00380 [Actinomycetota bacterium]|nr:hypothetical protein [Actinomycetota bacterium]
MPKPRSPRSPAVRPFSPAAVRRLLERSAWRRAVWATIGALAVAGALVTIDPAGWVHPGGSAVTLRSSAGEVITSGGAKTARPGGAGGRAGVDPQSGPLVRSGRVPTPSELRRLPPLPKPAGALPAVPALSTTRSVDAIVTLPATITPAEVTALVHLQGLSAVEEVDVGTVSLAGSPAVTFGVDPGTFRQFTPTVTAGEDALWRYLAGGALVSSYELAADRSLPLGKNLAIKPSGSALAPTSGWLGALASLGLPGVDLVVSHAYSDRLGLTPNSGLVVSASKVDPHALAAALTTTFPGASVELLHPDSATGSADRPALPAPVNRPAW